MIAFLRLCFVLFAFLALGSGLASATNAEQASEALKKGRELLDKRDLTSAEQLLDDAVRLQPDLAAAYYYRGYVHSLRRDFDRAIADYGVAIRLMPGYVGGYLGRGLAYESNGVWDKALADFRQAVKLCPANLDVRNRVVIVTAKKGALSDFISERDAFLRLWRSDKLTAV